MSKENLIPELRFTEFGNEGKWEVESLGEIAEIVTGSTPSTSEPLYYNGTKLFVSPADINVNRYVSQTKTTLSDIGFSKTRKIKANSVLFVCIGSTIGKVAQNKFECATNQQLNSLIPYDGNSSDFLYSILDFNSTNIASIAGNHAVPLINKTSFSAIKLNFPPTFKEQQKIASCLSSLDAIITEQTEKIEQLKLHKKGLMQGLFPKINN
jgi:type I restriction enzyme S subunit